MNVGATKGSYFGHILLGSKFYEPPLMFRTKQVIKVMRAKAKDKGDKKTDSNKYK